MFSVKLCRPEMMRIASAESVSVYNETSILRAVILHHADGNDEIYYVGRVDDDTSYVDPYKHYDRIIIENAGGHATEIVEQPSSVVLPLKIV